MCPCGGIFFAMKSETMGKFKLQARQSCPQQRRSSYINTPLESQRARTISPSSGTGLRFAPFSTSVTNPSIRTDELRLYRDYTMLVTSFHELRKKKKHTRALTWSLLLPVSSCMRAVICLHSCAFQTELCERNPFAPPLPTRRIPAGTSSARLWVWAAF